MVTNRPDLLLGILTADCAPVLLADPEAGVIGAAHAGWKGAVGGICADTVAAMVALGADPPSILAAIGPTISGANYEVGPEIAAEIVALDPAAAGHISRPARQASREHFDIPGLLSEQLLEAGVGLVERPRPLHLRRPRALTSPTATPPTRHHHRPPDRHDRAVA